VQKIDVTKTEKQRLAELARAAELRQYVWAVWRYVADHAGTTRMAAASRVSPLRLGYESVDRAIAEGYIVVVPGDRRDTLCAGDVKPVRPPRGRKGVHR